MGRLDDAALVLHTMQRFAVKHKEMLFWQLAHLEKERTDARDRAEAEQEPARQVLPRVSVFSAPSRPT